MRATVGTMAKVIMMITRKIRVAMEMRRTATIRKVTARRTRSTKTERKSPVKAATLDSNPKIVSFVGQ